MIQRQKRQMGFWVVVTFAVTSLLACSSSSSDPAVPVEPTSTTDTQKQASSAVSCGRTMTNLVSQLSKRVSPVRSESDRSLTETTRAGNIEETKDCTAGGTNAVTMDWTGPDPQDVTDCSQVDDLEATLILNACIENKNADMEQSLTLNIKKNGGLCDPDSMQSDVTNLHVIESGDVSLDFQSDSLQLETTEITNSDDDTYMTHVKMVLTGDARGTANDIHYDAQFENFEQIVDTDDNTNFVLEISGDIKSECMDQWATVETIVPIRYEEKECPTEGEIQITIGGETTTVIHSSDGSVTVGDTTYDSCKDMQESCNG